MPIGTLNISFESTLNKQQYITKITGREVRHKKLSELNFFCFFCNCFFWGGTCLLVPPFKCYINCKRCVSMSNFVLELLMVTDMVGIFFIASIVDQQLCNEYGLRFFWVSIMFH